MTNMLNPTNISALKFNEQIADKVDQICQPLAQYFGIGHFGFIRIFKDGRMLRMANNQQWTRKYFETRLYNDLDLYSMRDVPNNESRLLLLTGEPQSEHFSLLCKEFKIWHALGIYEKFSGYSDFWFFASSPENEKIINFYINNTGVLKNFTLYFKDKVSQDLKNIDSGKLISTTLKIEDNSLHEKEKVTNFFDNLNINSYKLNEKLSISRKEFECLLYLVQGRTMKESARLMNISYRTVEFHLNNIKKKIKAHKKSHIIDFMLDNEVFVSLLPS